MIDVYEELNKYASVDINSESAAVDNEFSIIIKNAARAYERLGKEQYKSSSTLEELFEILEENKDKDELIANFKEIIGNNQKKISGLLNGLTGFSDAFENIYLFAVKSGDKALIEALSIQKEKNTKLLLLCNLTPVGKSGEIFDSRFHIAKDISFDEQI